MKQLLKNKYFQITAFNLVVLVLANIMIYNIMEQFILDELRAEFEKKVALGRQQLDLKALESEDGRQLKSFADRMKELTHLRTTILNRQGKVLADSDVPAEDLKNVENHLSREEIQEALMHGAGIASRLSKTIDQELIYYSETIRKDGRIIGFYRTAIFMPDVNAKLSFIKSLIFKVDLIIIFMIITTLALIFVNKRHQLAAAAKELSNRREKNEFLAIGYQDDHQINKLLREINKLIEWSGDELTAVGHEIDRLRNILNSIIAGVMAFSQSGKILFTNDAFRKIFGIDEQNLQNEEIYKWIHFPPLIRDLEIFLNDQSLPEISSTTKYYGENYIEYRIFRQKIGKETDQGYLLTVRDITRLHQLETVRRDFVANVSHEFKTPLSSIRGYAETLLSGAADDKETAQKFLKKIERQTIRLEHLVGDILELAKIEKKDITDKTKIDIVAMMGEIVDEFTPIAQQAGLDLKMQIDNPDLKLIVEANPDMIHTIIANLLSNAIQYNRPKGRVIMHLSRSGAECSIAVEDTGIGISEDELSRIFERFFRTNDARSIFLEGTGLGLSIVKNALDSMDGKIDVTSKPGKGTTFTVRMPLANEDG